MPAVSPEITTIDALQALPEDGLRHELLDGVHVVTPAPALFHQATVRELMALLIPALRGQDRFQLFSSPADVVLGPRTLVPARCLRDRAATRDRGAKRRIYQRAGVAEYWIVDLDARLIERWRPGDERPEILDDRLVC